MSNVLELNPEAEENHLDDDLLLEYEELMSEEAKETEPSEPIVIHAYADSHLVIGDESYQTSGYITEVLRLLAGRKGELEEAQLLEKMYGGFKGYEAPTPAQMDRFQDALVTLAGIETAIGHQLFTVSIYDDAPDTQVYTSHYKLTRHKAALLEAEQELEPEEEAATEKATGLTDTQQAIVNVITNPAHYTDTDDGIIPFSVLFQEVCDTNNPDIDQQIEVNTSLASLNAWLQEHGIDFVAGRFVRPHIGAVLMTNSFHRIGSLQQQIDSVVAEAEATTEPEAEAALTAVTLVEDTEPEDEPQELPQPINLDEAVAKVNPAAAPKEVERKKSNSVLGRCAKYLPPNMTIRRSRSIVEECQLPGSEADIMNALDGIWTAYKTGLPLSVQHQKDIIALRQSINKASSAVESTRLISAMRRLDESALGALMITYWGRMAKISGSLTQNVRFEESFEANIAVAIYALDTASLRFDPNRHSYPNAYLGQRMYGDVVDNIRATTDWSRSKKVSRRPLSIDAPIDLRSMDHDMAVLSDFLLSADEATGDLVAAIDSQSDVEEIMGKLEEFFGSSEIQVGHTSSSDRNKMIYLCDNGLLRLMSEDQLALYLELLGDEDELTRQDIAEYYGITESRISQITASVEQSLASALSAWL